MDSTHQYHAPCCLIHAYAPKFCKYRWYTGGMTVRICVPNGLAAAIVRAGSCAGTAEARTASEKEKSDAERAVCLMAFAGLWQQQNAPKDLRHYLCTFYFPAPLPQKRSFDADTREPYYNHCITKSMPQKKTILVGASYYRSKDLRTKLSREIGCVDGEKRDYPKITQYVLVCQSALMVSCHCNFMK